MTNRRLGILESPKLAIGVSVAAAIAGIGFASWLSVMVTRLRFPEHPLPAVFNHPWLALVFGMLVGLPCAVWWKHSLRKHREYHIQCAMTPPRSRLGYIAHIPTVIDCLCLGASVWVAQYLAYRLDMSGITAFWGPLIVLILTYPEQRDIYEAAKARLAEREG